MKFSFGRKKDKEEIQSPYQGYLLPLEGVNDEMFASKVMGDGFAVEPTDGKVYAPVNGTICVCFPTGHAIGISMENGVEILLHQGIDTVELDGEGFQLHIQEGDIVKQGQLLCTIDLDLIKKRGKQTTSMFVVTSGNVVDVIKLHQNVSYHESGIITIHEN